MTFWFCKKLLGCQIQDTKCISLRFIPKHFFKFYWGNNGAVKGKDGCYDFNIHFLGIFFSYTNFNYK